MSEYKLKTGKIGEKVTSAYKKIEDAVVVGYKKIEDSFVDTFLEKVEDLIGIMVLMCLIPLCNGLNLFAMD